MRKPLTSSHTIRSCYIGYITQAIVNNFVPLLFLVLRDELGLSLTQLTMLITVNFGVQLLVDLLSALVVDRLGYRPCTVAAHLFSVLGLLGLTLLPSVLPAYTGLLASVVLMAVGGGLIEVLISPIVESCPTERKEAAMSLLHSFYCWGHAGLVLVCTGYFVCFGVHSWRSLAWLLTLVPLAGAALFTRVPLYPVVKEGTRALPFRELVRQPVFSVLMLMMICAGASEQAMSQWSSAFAEAGLHVSKTIGDLAGPCAFALLMGSARALYGRFSERLPIRAALAGCACLCAACYLVTALSADPVIRLIGCAVCGFSVGVFWPGTFSMAAQRLPGGGTAMYALMALAGDIGCGGGPTLAGLVTDAAGSFASGFLAALVFPALMLLCCLLAGRGRTAPRGK